MTVWNGPNVWRRKISSQVWWSFYLSENWSAYNFDEYDWSSLDPVSDCLSQLWVHIAEREQSTISSRDRLNTHFLRGTNQRWLLYKIYLTHIKAISQSLLGVSWPGPANRTDDLLVFVYFLPTIQRIRLLSSCTLYLCQSLFLYFPSLN